MELLGLDWRWGRFARIDCFVVQVLVWSWDWNLCLGAYAHYPDPGPEMILRVLLLLQMY